MNERGRKRRSSLRRAVAATVSLFLCVEVAHAQTAGTLPGLASAGPFTVSAEALLWWFKDSPAPVPLVTDGLVGNPGTRVFLGGTDRDTGANPGVRLTAGYAVTERWGVEGSFFYIPSRSTSQSVSSSGQPGSIDLVAPFFNAATNVESGTGISLSPVYRGRAREELTNSLLGAELNGAWTLPSSGGWRVDLLGGVRYLRLRETYTLTTSSPFIPPFPSDVWDTTDEFDASNDFVGPQLGVRARLDLGPFFAHGTVKVAVGAMVQSMKVSGSLVANDFTDFGPTQTFPGGYFALPTNIGEHRRTVLAVVPEVGLNLGYRLTPRVSLLVGYTLLYTNNVARPGNQIDRTINPTQSTAHTENPGAQLEGPARPSFKFKGSDFWAQGINVGLAFRF
jgi:hypothetical protein